MRWQVLGNLVGIGYFVFKVYLISVIFIWIRGTVPRLRADQLMRFSWLLLIPMTLGDIVLIAFLYLLCQSVGASTLVFLLVLGIVHWLLLLGFVVLVGRATRAATRRAQRPALRAQRRVREEAHQQAILHS